MSERSEFRLPGRKYLASLQAKGLQGVSEEMPASKPALKTPAVSLWPRGLFSRPWNPPETHTGI